jgi:hypothetical protein
VVTPNLKNKCFTGETQLHRDVSPVKPSFIVMKMYNDVILFYSTAEVIMVATMNAPIFM